VFFSPTTMSHPEVDDLIALHPEAADAITTAVARGFMLAGQQRQRINKSETADLPVLSQGLVRGLVLTRILLMHYEWLESNGLGGTEKKSAKELTRLVREQYHFLRRKATKLIGVRGEGTPEQNLSNYLEVCTDTYWDVFDTADKAEDARMLLSLWQCYNEGLIADSATGQVVGAEKPSEYAEKP
jgi:hypothetical protein